LVYPISFAANENEYDYILLRTQKGVMKLVNQLYYFNHSIQNFTVSNGLFKWEIKEYPQNLKYIYDYGFRIFIRKCYNGNVGDAYRKESVFYPNCDGSSSFWKGEKLESAERGSWCKPTLNYLDWKIEANQLDDMQTSCCSNVSKKDRWGLINYDFVDQFAFVLKLNNIIKSQSGVVISFIGIIPKNEIVRFYYEDIKTIEEINKISEYKVIPIVK
jgi:hypothetical protein